MAANSHVVNTSYTSAGCNRCPNSADWGRNNLICYGFNRAIAVYQPEGVSAAAAGGILATLSGHADRVNCVIWIENGFNDETEIVSGSTDVTARIWSVIIKKDQVETKLECILNGHTDSVTCASAVYLSQSRNAASPGKETLIATASVDSTVRIWNRCGKEVTQLQMLDYQSGFALSVALFIIPGTNVPLLACGCDDHKVHLYTRGDSVEQFSEVLVLTGHEDWVRGLDFTIDDSGDVLLASCAQDHLIRVWRLVHRINNKETSSALKSVSELSKDESITVKETIFSFNAGGKELQFAVSLESVLWGHDNWVYSVKWQRAQLQGDGKQHQQMKLLSASMDKTMILWCPDVESGMWIEQVRVGNVGGNTLGFYGGLFSPCGHSILAHGYQGAFNQWSLNEVTETWEPQVTGGGHFDSVVDLAWSGSGGDFILTASSDQTSRLHAPWVRQSHKPTWYEIARPQVHGYDLQCLTPIRRYSFASGADEKLVRMFTAPRNFISNFCHICGHNLDQEFSSEDSKYLPEGANVPALGLSNKAVFIGGDKKADNDADDNTKMGQYPENYFSPVNLTAPPSEDQLLQNTLWPEESKLYGHGYEIFSLAAHPNGKLLASACKAAKADAANILLWDLETKKQVGSLAACTLTVTQMAFSHEGHFLLAVSRDRTWALFQQTDSGAFILKASVNKKTSMHSRIIWSCAWSHDDKYFFTASRDKKVMVWSVDTVLQSDAESPPKPAASETLPDSVTAISVSPVLVSRNKYFLAMGLDNGHIHLYTWSPPASDHEPGGRWTLVVAMNQSEAHHLKVNRLAFRPHLGRTGHQEYEDSPWLQLASCGADHALRIFDIDISTL